MRDSGLLALRFTVGGYLAVHGAQKLFGHFDGPGLDKAGVGFERMGLRPGKAFASLAATSELAGGLLTVAGLAFPVGPVAIAGSMAVASAAHSDRGAMGQKGGFELPLTNMAAALALAVVGPGHYSVDSVLRLRLPRGLVRLCVVGAAALSAYSAATVLRHKRAAVVLEPASGPGPVPAPAEAAVGQDSHEAEPVTDQVT